LVVPDAPRFGLDRVCPYWSIAPSSRRGSAGTLAQSAGLGNERMRTRA